MITISYSYFIDPSVLDFYVIHTYTHNLWVFLMKFSTINIWKFGIQYLKKDKHWLEQNFAWKVLIKHEFNCL